MLKELNRSGGVAASVVKGSFYAADPPLDAEAVEGRDSSEERGFRRLG